MSTTTPISVESGKRAVAFYRDAAGRLHPVLRSQDLSEDNSGSTDKKEPKAKKAAALPKNVVVIQAKDDVNPNTEDESTSSSASSQAGGTGLSTPPPHMIATVHSMTAQGATIAEMLRKLLEDPHANGVHAIGAIHHVLGPIGR